MNDAFYDLEHHIINYSSIYFVCVSSLYTVAMTRFHLQQWLNQLIEDYMRRKTV